MMKHHPTILVSGFLLLILPWTFSHMEEHVQESELPRIRTHDGVLYFEAGRVGNGTISIRAASVKVGDDDLFATIEASRRIPEISRQLDLLISASLGIHNDSSTATINPSESLRYPAGGNDSASISQVAQENTRKLNRIQRKVNRLETKLLDALTMLARDECSSSPCKNGATCIDKYNGFTCICATGWQGLSCDIDRDECSLINGTDWECKNGGSCINTQGSYRCECPPAWHGVHCTSQRDDCTGASNEELCGHGTCLSVARSEHNQTSYSCLCDAGWTKNGSTNSACNIDVDECKVSKSPCSTDPAVDCINTPGSFRCGSCPSGYDGNGIVCMDIDECLVDNGGCSKDPLVACVNTIGSFYCGACPYGSFGDGITCTPFGNSCLVNNGGCSPHATCVNSYLWNSPICNCNPGFVGSGLGTNGCRPVARLSRLSTPCAASPCQNGGICLAPFLFPNGTLTPDDYYRCDCVPPWVGKNCDQYMTTCGGNLTGSIGRFNSPTEPGYENDSQYLHNANCRWEITVNPDEVVWLKFLSFQLEQNSACKYDFVEIIDPAATATNTNGTLARLCGSNPPEPMASSSNKMVVVFQSDASVHYGGFIALYTSIPKDKICGGELRQQSGKIQSPGFPDDYPAYSTCNWIITVEEGHQIVLNITQFDLEYHEDCHADYVEIRNGGSENSPMIHKFCGHLNSTQLKSHTNRMFIRFVSDRFRHAGGFQATYYSTPSGCSGVMRAPYGAITSPNYPQPYYHNAECYWHIHAASGSSVQVSVVDFDLENSAGCKYDYLAFYDGSLSSGTPLETLCGTTITQKPIRSLSNEMHIKFRSDLSSHGRGFHLTYQAVCEKRILKERSGVIESPGFPESYPPDSKCDYTIEVSKGNKINLTFSHFGLPDSKDCLNDYLKIYNGDSEADALFGTYCGNTPPKSIQSLSNKFHIRFKTGPTGRGVGFRMEWTTHGCGGDIVVERRDSNVARYITSPNHPGPYPPNIVCEWRLISSEYGYGVELDVLQIDLEAHGMCRWDKLEMFNGPDEKSASLSTVCHTQNKTQSLSSSSPIMYVRFSSDQSKAGSGFRARYSLVKSICGGNYSTPTGAFSSTNHPQPYPTNLVCGYLITVAEQHVVVLNVTVLDIDEELNCETEYLALYDGEGTGSPLIAKNCGKNPSQMVGTSIRSSSNKMFIQFRSNNETESTRTGYKVAYSTGCGAVLTATEAMQEFVSPNFPNRYGKSLNCPYIIQSPSPNTQVILQFNFMDIEERNNCSTGDYVEIRNGNNAAAPVIGRYCGRKIPPAIVSTSNALHILFKTNDWREEAGWRATYSNALTSCGGDLSALEGLFVTPGYPENYPNGVECAWAIKASPGNSIDLNFNSFNLGNKEDDPFCNSDYVEIRRDNAGGELLGRYCGSKIPDGISASVETLWIMFRSSDETTHPGFLAEYKLRHGGDIIGKTAGQIASPLYPMNYPHNSTFSWTITVASGSVIRAKWLVMDMEDRRCYFDYISVYNGANTQSPLIGKYCGYELPQPIQTAGNQLFLMMHTDRYGGNGQGFLMEWQEINPTTSGGFYYGSTNVQTSEVRVNRTIGRIISPGYPLSIMPNQTHQWRLRTDDTSHIEVTLEDLYLSNSTQCDADKPRLHMYDGPTYRKFMGSYCGKLSQPVVKKSSTNSVKLILNTQSPTFLNVTGFNLTYRAVCGGNIYATSGQIRTDGYPGGVASDAEVLCSWNITTDFGMTFDIIFEDFELGGDSTIAGCNAHNVTLWNGFGSDSPVLAGPFCGLTIPPPIQTRNNRFEVRYYKSAAVSTPGRGFSLKFRTTRYACGGELRLTDFVRSGLLATPKYPESYPTNIECEWTIVAPGGDSIRLDFADKFELERPNNNACPWDYLEVRDGATPEAKLIGTYCGQQKPGTIRSRSNVLYLKFRSDRGLSHAGFQANYSISSCGGTIIDQSGTIFSPGYPGSYPVSGDSDCEWYIQVPAGHFIDFELREFVLPDYFNCSAGHYVEFRNNSRDGDLIKRFCGNQPFTAFSSPDSLVYIRFRTSLPVPLRGLQETAFKFRIFFNANSEGCGGELLGPSGIITSPGFPNSYPNNRLCIWKITSTVGRRILLESLDLEVEGSGLCQSDSVEVYNGIQADSPRMDRICGTRKIKISSSMNTMTIKFQTDSSKTSRGFRIRYSSNEPAACGGSLVGTSGVITSPGFDLGNNSAKYDPNDECIWTITPVYPYGPSTIFLQITYLETEQVLPQVLNTMQEMCRSDFIEVRSGLTPGDPLVQTFCGRMADLLNSSVAIPGPAAYIRWRTDYSLQLKGFRMEYTIMPCGGILTDPSGVITNFGLYGVDTGKMVCAWLIGSLGGPGQIELSFNNVISRPTANCSDGSLEVLNGRFHNSPLITRLCGDSTANPVRSQSSTIFVRYQSSQLNESVALRSMAFSAFYQTVTNGCGGTIHGNEGTIQTPGRVDNADYPDNVECIWDIFVDTGYHINLTFPGRFDIESSQNCTKDYVELQELRTFDEEDEWTTLIHVCGHETPNTTFSSSNRLRVKFHSDGTNNAKGFTASWSIGCGGRLSESTGVIVSPGFPNKPANNLDCRWEINAPYIELTFDPNHFDIEGSRRLLLKEANRLYGAYYSEILCHDYLTVYGGDPTNSTVISKPPRICGGSGLYGASGEVPRPIYAEKRMAVEFHTDFALAGNGFRLVYKTSTRPFPINLLPSSSSATRIPWITRMPAYPLSPSKLLI